MDAVVSWATVYRTQLTRVEVCHVHGHYRLYNHPTTVDRSQLTPAYKEEPWDAVNDRGHKSAMLHRRIMDFLNKCECQLRTGRNKSNHSSLTSADMSATVQTLVKLHEYLINRAKQGARQLTSTYEEDRIKDLQYLLVQAWSTRGRNADLTSRNPIMKLLRSCYPTNKDDRPECVFYQKTQSRAIAILLNKTTIL